MLTDKEFRQIIREAISDRLEHLRSEYVHWLNELKKLDDLSSVSVDPPGDKPADVAQRANVVHMTPRL